MSGTYQGRSGSTSSRASSSTSSSTSNDYSNYIHYDSQNKPFIILSDGTNSTNIYLNGSQGLKSVPEALDDYLRRHASYEQFLNDAKIRRGETVRVTATGPRRGGVGAYNNEKDRINAAAESQKDFNAAINSNTSITLAEVLKSGANGIFYIKKNYYYIGKNIESSPRPNNQDAANATAFLDERNNINFGTGAGAANSSKKQYIWLLLPLGVGIVGMFLLNSGKKKKKRRR